MHWSNDGMIYNHNLQLYQNWYKQRISEVDVDIVARVLKVLDEMKHKIF